MRIQDLMLCLLPVTPITWQQTAKRKLYTLTKQANDFRGRIFSREDIFARGYFREKIFSREDIFAGRYFRVNSIFAKISSRENISNSLYAKFSSRENKVLYSIRRLVAAGGHSVDGADPIYHCDVYRFSRIRHAFASMAAANVIQHCDVTSFRLNIA